MSAPSNRSSPMTIVAPSNAEASRDSTAYLYGLRRGWEPQITHRASPRRSTAFAHKKFRWRRIVKTVHRRSIDDRIGLSLSPSPQLNALDAKRLSLTGADVL